MIFNLSNNNLELSKNILENVCGGAGITPHESQKISNSLFFENNSKDDTLLPTSCIIDREYKKFHR